MLFLRPDNKTRDTNAIKVSVFLGFIYTVERFVITVFPKYLPKKENINTKERLIQRKVISCTLSKTKTEIVKTN